MRLLPWMHPTKARQDNQNYEQYNAYSQLLDRNGQWIEVADTKASVILGFLVATFPVLASPALPIVQKLIKAIPRHTNWWAYLPVAGFITLLVLFFVVALVTLARIMMTLIPRLTRERKPGLIFFGDTASQEYKQWQQLILALDPQILSLEVLEQVYTTACIAACKHKHVRQAIRALIATVLLGLVLYVLSQIAS